MGDKEANTIYILKEAEQNLLEMGDKEANTRVGGSRGLRCKPRNSGVGGGGGGSRILFKKKKEEANTLYILKQAEQNLYL